MKIKNGHLFVILAFLLLLSVVITFCREIVSDVDLGTGRIRRRNYCGIFVLSETVDDTFANIADNLDGNEQWEIYSRWRPIALWRTHRDFVYGVAPVAMGELLAQWELEPVSIDQQQTIANYLLKLLRERRFEEVVPLTRMTAKQRLEIAQKSQRNLGE